MSKYPDLWQDDVATPADTGPLAILEDQARYLSRKTGGAVEGEVVTLAKSSPAQKRVAFYVNAPSIDYSYKLLELQYDPSNPYPLDVLFYDESVKVENEAILLMELGRMLNDERTNRVIRELVPAHASDES